MFTGLVEAVGTITNKQSDNDAMQLVVSAPDNYLQGVQLGESICTAGVCLTVTEVSSDSFTALAVAETLRRTTLGSKTVGDRVNLERALRADARLGGHMVQGHVDAVGAIISMREEGEGWWVTIEPPWELMKYVSEKGSICLDGVSLTVANIAYNRFSVALIPHTRQMTTLDTWQLGTLINIEADVIAKYVERLMQWHSQAADPC